jgi:hypothetical protein
MIRCIPGKPAGGARALLALILVAIAPFSLEARAQNPDEPGADPDAEAPAASEPADDEPEASTDVEDGEPAPRKRSDLAASESVDANDLRRDDSLPEDTDAGDGASFLTWSGSLETDTGFAHYEAEEESVIDDTLYDYRGRFVVGPLVELPLGEDLFFAATGQLVAWVKNNQDNPFIGSDDAWGMLGGRRDDGSPLWDIQAGRFEAWMVYKKFSVIDQDPRPQWGQGESTGAFDLFTLEDQGALCRPPLANREYCVDIYEVNHILLREEVASVAAHFYPVKGLGIELHGRYGQQVSTNVLGGRLALQYSPVDWLAVSAAAEVRAERQGSPPKRLDPVDRTYPPCNHCGRLDQRGAVGGIAIKVPGLGKLEPELAFSFAQALIDSWNTDAVPIPDNSPSITSYGGYAQLGYGDFLLGGAMHRTEKDTLVGSGETHDQYAGYARYAIRKNLSLKLIGTYAQGVRISPDSSDLEDIRNSFTAARLRLKYMFNGL